MSIELNRSRFDPVQVPLERILPNPFQPRSDMDPTGIRQLAANIKERGLLQIPQAREKAGMPGYYELAFGHRRTEAFRLLHKTEPDNPQWQTIPLFVVRANDFQMFLAAVAEGEHQEKFSPIDKARAMKFAITHFKVPQAEAGRHFRLNSQGAVVNHLNLLKMPEIVQQAIHKSVISENQARLLRRIAEEDMIRIAEAMIKLDPAERQGFFGEQVRACLRQISIAEGGTKRGPRGRRPTPPACPHCHEIPASYVQVNDVWQCGKCEGVVLLKVTA